MGKTVRLEEQAEHMANHNTPYSEGVIREVMTDMINCIRELVLLSSPYRLLITQIKNTRL